VGFLFSDYNIFPDMRNKGYQLRESPAPYKALFEAENKDIDLENTFFWDVKDE
jgi:hypothetical protein